MDKTIIRITTVPISLEKLLEGQLSYMRQFFNVIAVSSDLKKLNDYGDKEGVETYSVNLTRKITLLTDILAVYRLYKFLKYKKPDIVHTHTPKAGIVGMLAAKIAGVPVRLHTVAGLPLEESVGLKKKVLEFVEKLTYQCSTKVYPNSKGLYDFIVDNKLINKEKLKIIGNGSSNGIDIDFFNPKIYNNEQNIKLRDSLAVSSKSKIFIFIGRLVGDKGVNELVKAFDIISKKNDVKLLLLGNFENELDPLFKETLRIINQNPNIIFLGYKQDIRPYLHISNMLLLPSYREGFPNVVLQAGAMGVPCIVSNINGCNEIIENEVNGLIVRKKSTNDLQAAMSKFVNNAYSFNRNIIRLNIKSRYSRADFWKDLLKEYNSLV